MNLSDSSKTKKRIILVDDDKYAVETLSKLLSEDGYKVDVCFNGKEAMKKMEFNRYDVIITDLRMPEIGGLELLKNVKKIYPELPVIVITAFGEVDSYLDAFVKGAYEYINKPIKYEELIRLLEAIFKNKKGRE
ncbi:MAG: hypothetical protein A2W05_10175 [Candidatus Schekmanbacteria bacterium RBG_16_38_10]|uniref:Response regulatory domain-containing protein n=1 Tax=Candidatus Schekmanbacteria bacterium RBG_16_38_10 TaxID=1817879 RepID=A0A1F7RRK0_9BACT|nr:MAG: hypothetical protein A2W05_10175 [Candidatus Schekmanbacteria bacterium RBG_16_38_10]